MAVAEKLACEEPVTGIESSKRAASQRSTWPHLQQPAMGAAGQLAADVAPSKEAFLQLELFPDPHPRTAEPQKALLSRQSRRSLNVGSWTLSVERWAHWGRLGSVATRKNFQLPTSNFQRPTSNVQRPTSNVQRPTSNVQRPTSNVQLL